MFHALMISTVPQKGKKLKHPLCPLGPCVIAKRNILVYKSIEFLHEVQTVQSSAHIWPSFHLAIASISPNLLNLSLLLVLLIFFCNLLTAEALRHSPQSQYILLHSWLQSVQIVCVNYTWRLKIALLDQHHQYHEAVPCSRHGQHCTYLPILLNYVIIK